MTTPQQRIDEAAGAPADAVGFEHLHRRARTAGLRQHVDRVRRADDAVGPGQQARIGIRAIGGAAPEQGVCACRPSLAQCIDHPGRRAPRRGDHQALRGRCGVEKGRQSPQGRGIEPVVRAVAAQQHRGTRRGQGGERGKGGTRVREPGVVDRIQAAQQGEDVRPGEAIVLGCDDEIPVRRIDSGIEDLDGAAAAHAQQARRQCRLPAAADRQRGWLHLQVVECRTESMGCARQQAGRDPAPRRAWREHRLARLAAECTRQRLRLAYVAGVAIGQCAEAA